MTAHADTSKIKKAAAAVEARHSELLLSQPSNLAIATAPAPIRLYLLALARYANAINDLSRSLAEALAEERAR